MTSVYKSVFAVNYTLEQGATIDCFMCVKWPEALQSLSDDDWVALEKILPDDDPGRQTVHDVESILRHISLRTRFDEKVTGPLVLTTDSEMSIDMAHDFVSGMTREELLEFIAATS